MTQVVLNIYAMKIKRRTETKKLEILLLSCGRKDVIPNMTTRIAIVGTEVRWRLKVRKRIDFVYRRFLRYFKKRER